MSKNKGIDNGDCKEKAFVFILGEDYVIDDNRHSQLLRAKRLM